MSPSGLHHHFKYPHRHAPFNIKRCLHLQEARRLMLAHAMDASAVAFRVGYVSRSQFSREYSRLIGAPALRDMEQAR